MSSRFPPIASRGYLPSYFKILALLVASCIISLPHISTFAAAPTLTLEVKPNSVELRPNAEAVVIAILSNQNNQVISDVKLTAFTNSTIQTEVTPSDPVTLEPFSIKAWEVRIKHSTEGPDSGNVHLRVDYKWQETGEAASLVPGTIITSFDVTVPTVTPVPTITPLPTIPPIAEIADVTITSTLSTLDEKQTGKVYLTVANNLSVPLTIGEIRTDKPDEFINLTTEFSPQTEIPPRGKISIPYDVSIKDESTNVPIIDVSIKSKAPFRPGKYLLVFDIPIEWHDKGEAKRSTLIASHQIDVGVFGESQILTLLGIPAFFLMPGFLLLIFLELLWSRGNAQSTVPAFLNIKTSPLHFAAIAISISLLAALIYPRFTGRDFLQAYNLTDVLYLWFSSIAVGILLFVVYLIGRWLLLQIRRWTERRLDARIPALGDDALTTLRKLNLRGKNLHQCEPVWLKHNNKPYPAFVIGGDIQDNSETAALWVTPQICVRRGISSDPTKYNEAINAINAGDLDTFLDLMPDSKPDLSWVKNLDAETLWPDGLTPPYQAARADVRPFDGVPLGGLVKEC